MNKKNFQYLNSTFATLALSCMLIVVGFLLLVINNGLSYSDFEQQIAVLVTQEEQNRDETVTQIANLSNVSRVNREEYIVIFENISEDLVQTNVEQITSNTVISRIIPSKSFTSITFDYVILTTVFTLVSFLWAIFLSYRNSSQKISLSYISQIGTLFGISIVVSFFMQLSIISIISTVYQVQEGELLSLFVATFITVFLLLSAIIQGSQAFSFSFEKFLNELKKYSSLANKFLPFGVLVLITPVMFGFGTRVVLLLALIILAICISGISVGLTATISALVIDILQNRTNNKKTIHFVEKKQKTSQLTRKKSWKNRSTSKKHT